MVLSLIFVVVYILFCLAGVALFGYLLLLIIKALKKYINTEDVRKEKEVVRKSLAETLREHRIQCKMTQEFVAETLGVSRQAVSKWETGVTDPSTSNLLVLAKLYGVSAEELLRGVAEGKTTEEKKES